MFWLFSTVRYSQLSCICFDFSPLWDIVSWVVAMEVIICQHDWACLSRQPFVKSPVCVGWHFILDEVWDLTDIFKFERYAMCIPSASKCVSFALYYPTFSLSALSIMTHSFPYVCLNYCICQYKFLSNTTVWKVLVECWQGHPFFEEQILERKTLENGPEKRRDRRRGKQPAAASAWCNFNAFTGMLIANVGRAASSRHEFGQHDHQLLHLLLLHQHRHHHNDHPCHHQRLPGLAWCNFNAFKGMLIAGAQLPASAARTFPTIMQHNYWPLYAAQLLAAQSCSTTTGQVTTTGQTKLPGRKNHSMHTAQLSSMHRWYLSFYKH